MSDEQQTPMVHEPAATYATEAKQGRDWTEEELEEMRGRNQRAIRLLDSLINCSEEEAQDQKETFEILRKALGEDRESYRKLFPGTREQGELHLTREVTTMSASIAPASGRTTVPSQAVTAHPTREKVAGLIGLLDEWLADESGYDERTWPVVKRAIDENRPSTRKRFSD